MLTARDVLLAAKRASTGAGSTEYLQAATCGNSGKEQQRGEDRPPPPQGRQQAVKPDIQYQSGGTAYLEHLYYTAVYGQTPTGWRLLAWQSTYRDGNPARPVT